MIFRPRSKLRKAAAIILVVMMLFVQNAHPFFVPKAQAFTGFVSIIESIPERLNQVWKLISETITTAAMSALLNGVAYMTRKIAYDTAVLIAEGGQGKSKLILDDPKKYLLDVAGNAAGEAISALGEPFGLNLCQIPDPRINVYLQIGLRSIFPDGTEPKKPKCSWQEISQSWGDIGNVLEKRYGKGGSKFASHMFNANLSVTQSDFGVALGAIGKVDQNQVHAGISASIEELIAEGSKSVKSLISGEVLTPASAIKEKIAALSEEAGTDTANTQIAGIYGSELAKLPLIGANVFLNTLASQLLNKVFTGLFPPSSPGSGGGARQAFSFFDQAPQGFAKQAEKALGFLLAPTIQEVNVYNILDEYGACPDAPGLNNCVMDDGLRQAIDRSTQQSLTIKEAMDQNLLHANWPLISPRREEDNTNIKECYLNQYCYSNLQKLRKVRILPLGFELAALKSSPDQPWTLGQVVAGFNNCNNQGAADARNPFCHLIDPNWVIRSPQVRCQSQLVGPILVDRSAPTRHDECMDLQTCIAEAKDGTCENWGYCTKEKNTWRLGGESCPSYYNTCAAYQNLADNTAVSYLSRTIDFGECSAASAGCRAYVSEQQNDGWVTPIDVTRPAGIALKQLGRPQIFYFNKQVQTCPSGAEGCTTFYSGQRGADGQFVLSNSGNYAPDRAALINLKRAPDYLGCYDINRAANSPEINWPQTRAQALNDVSNHTRCANFAAACAPSEVGCESYTPVAGGVTIPGIVQANNACDARCVGYETFRQEATSFEAGAFPLYFIPNSPGARQCGAESAGCDEFTNLEAAAAGGEQTQYYSYIRACERPTGTNERAFFSWEGSEREGYVLRTHRLLPIDQAAFDYLQGLGNNPPGPTQLNFNAPDTVNTVFQIGSPAYNDTTLASLQDKYNRCNAVGYSLLINNPFAPGAASADCRALYDSAGNIYYRVLSDTVTVSPQCGRLRKTATRLYVDAALTAAGENLCQRQGGLWGDADRDGQNDCQRCFGGGRYRDGAGVYQTIPAESTQRSAESAG